MDSKAGFVAMGIGIGAAVGGAVMYWFDPSAGKRRRAHVRYEVRHAVKQVQNAGKHLQKTIDRTADDLSKISRMKVSDVAGVFVPKARAILAR